VDAMIEMGDPKMPYVGIIIWWLKKHAKKGCIKL
jgi:hypothetical protein